MTWPRPVPTVGDVSSAAERAGEPAGWAFEPDAIDAVERVIASRRDVRRFRPDPIPDEVLRRVLDAGHRGPSVGHSQPWRFIVVQEQGARDRAAALADRERLRQADLLEPDRRARLLDLQLEGIREAPLGVVVACDRRAAAGGVLGRATFTDTDLWSCACAIENMWLTARAVGLGLGWVTLFQPADLAQLLALPDGVETLGWLCLGWPDERPPEPGLQRHGWSERVPLDDVLIAERWPAPNQAPSAPVSHLAGPDQRAVVSARDSGDDLLTAPGSLGVLDVAVDRVLAVRSDVPTAGTLVLAAADHPVSRHGVSAYPAGVTADVVAATAAGESVGAVAARAAGLDLVWRYLQPAAAQGDLLDSDALDPSDVASLLADGVDVGREVGTRGLVCVGEVGIGNTTVAAALACVLLDRAAADLVGRGSGADTAMLHRKENVVSGAVARARAAHGSTLTRPAALLSALGGPEFAFLTGVTLGAAQVGATVVLDGLATGVAALIAVRLEPGARSVLVAGQRSRERGHAAVLTELGLEPILDVRLRAGEGVGACLAAQALLSALVIRTSAGRVS